MKGTRRFLALLNILGHLLLPILAIRERVLPWMPYLRPLYANRVEIRQFVREVRQINTLLRH